VIQIPVEVEAAYLHGAQPRDSVRHLHLLRTPGTLDAGEPDICIPEGRNYAPGVGLAQRRRRWPMNSRPPARCAAAPAEMVRADRVQSHRCGVTAFCGIVRAETRRPARLQGIRFMQGGSMLR